MLKTITDSYFEEIRHESPSYSRHGLVFCVTHPPQFSGIGTFEFHEGVCVEEVTKQIEHWNKGMLCDGKLYSRKCVVFYSVFIISVVMFTQVWQN